MNVSCSSCNTQYKIDETKVPPSGGFIKCKTCGERVRIPPPGDAIPLAGSNAPPQQPAPPTPPTQSPADGAIPLAGSAPAAPAPAGAIPLAGTEPPAAQPAPAGAIPLAGTAPAPPATPPATPPTPGGAIPLAGTEPPQTPPQTGAIPLAGTPDDEAPTVVTASPGAIPLAGTTPHEAETVVADTPSLPRSEGAIPLAGTTAPPDDEAPTVVAQTPSLPDTDAVPLAGSVPDDEAPTAIGPAPSALADLPPEEKEAPTQVTDTPKFLDNVPPATDGLEDLPATLSEEETATTEPDATALPTDLAGEAAPGEALDSGLFDDLPTAAEEAPSLDLGDLPVADGAAPSLMDDLPAADGAAPSLMDDLPAVDGAAPDLMDLPAELSLMDDPPDNTAVSALDGEAMSTPSLMVDDPLAEDQGSAPAIHPADLGLPPADGAATPTQDEAEPAPKRNIRTLAFAAGAVVVALVAAIALTTPFLGLQLVDPFGLVEPAVPTVTPQAKAKDKAKSKAKAKAKVKEPEPEPEPKVVELSEENVDQLGYAALQESTAALAASDTPDPGLLAWARFRLAAIYGDEEARKALSAGLPKRPQEIPKLEGLAAPAAVGGLALLGKAGPARKVGERMAKGRFKESAHLALALSTTYSKRPETPKALRQLDRAHKLDPDMKDAVLRRGELLLAGKDPAAGADTLAELATSAEDPDLTVLVARALIDAQQADHLPEVAATLSDAQQVEKVAPHRRPMAWQLLCHEAVRTGNLDKAIEIATKRLETTSELSARIELARLTAAAGGDGDAVLEAATAEKHTPADSAHIIAERVRIALRKGDVETAKAVRKEGDAIPAKKSGGWLKLVDGWLARQAKQAGAAKTAFNAAAKAKLPEGRLETALLSENEKVLMKKLSEVEKKTALPAASYHLARLMEQRGNPRGAAQLFTRVLWTDPTVIDPVDLVIEWADVMARSGQADAAMATVTALRENRPKDKRPVLALIGLKSEAGEHDEVVELYRGLVKANPKDSLLKVGLAGAFNRAGSHSQAQGTLEDLFKEDKKARTPEALLELARAWADREPYRARQLVKESIDAVPTAEKYNLLGALAIKRDQIDEARKTFAKALEMNPKYVEPRIALARIDLEARDYEAVVDGLEKVLEEAPNHREAATTLGDVYVELNKPREAIKRYEIALSTGDDEKLLMKVARLHLHRLSQLGPAIKALRHLIAINPKIAEAHFHLGMALKDQGQRRDAIASLKKCIELEPEGDWAQEAQTTIQDMQK